MLRLRRGAGRSEPPDPGEVLRRSIRERIAQCVGEEPGTVALDDAAIKEIEALQNMLRAYNNTQPRRNRPAWPVAALVVAIALSVWALLVVRVPATEASFALELSSVAFRVGRPPVLTAPNDATGVDEIELTDWIDASFVVADGVDEVNLNLPVKDWTSPYLEVAARPDHPVTVRPIMAPVGTWVRIRGLDSDGIMGLELLHPTAPLMITIDLRKGAEIEPPDPVARYLNPNYKVQKLILSARPTPENGACARLALRLRVQNPGGRAADRKADVETEAASAITPLVHMLPVDSLHFTEIRDLERVGRPSSTVLGGTVYLEEIAATEIDLRRNEYLEVRLPSENKETQQKGFFTDFLGAIARALLAVEPDALAPGQRACRAGVNADGPVVAPAEISQITLGRHGLTMEARGIVNVLSVGTPTSRRALMPSFLERLQAWPELPLFWGAFASVFGLGLAVLGWLRRSL